MTTFEEREKAFEAKYKLDQETQFKINVRRDKLLGLWVAEQLGLSGSEAQAYARTVVEADFAVPGDSDVIAKVLKDLKARGILLAEEKLVKELDRLAILARQQVLSEIKA
ncbi:MAG: DUF1476 domain-containing protein [Rhodospirillales bacterium]|nr:DUF1476 domain-containing protein [Rhodospirillales bacterium]